MYGVGGMWKDHGAVFSAVLVMYGVGGMWKDHGAVFSAVPCW